jgi:outer membrane lipoprotein carrier protein
MRRPPLLVLAPLLFVQDGAARAIDRAVASYATIRTARASFEQSVTNPLTGSTLKSRGTFSQARPDRFSFTFSEPKGDVITSDGKHVWIYLPSSAPGQVMRAPASADAAGSLDLIGEFFSNPRARYVIEDGGAATLDGHDVRMVSLSPKGPNAAFTKAKVWIDAVDGTLRQFEAEEPSGVVRLVRIVRFEPNAAVAREAFVFKVPRGVRVIDR